VVNAVVHRDYSRRGESIRVFYYADRIEIHSPGLLLPGITIEQMQRGDVTSKLRNSVLANLLRDIPGYMERIGSGIRLMLEETRQMGLPAPQFREQSEFIVTFHNAPTTEIPRVHRPGAISSQRTLWDEGSVLSTPAEEASLEQERRIEQTMLYVHNRGSITNREYRELTGVSEATARRDLETLVERKALKVVGKTCGRQYKLP
jgi:ATP-dependent DNA helicase RecG